MVKLEGQNSYGERFSLDVPMLAEDITFGSYLDFLAARKKYYQADEDEKAGIAASALMQALQHVIQGDLELIPFVLPDDLGEGGFPSIVKGVSLARLENHILKVARQGEENKRPENAGKYVFIYKGEEWFVGRKRATSFLTGMSFSAGEVIEVEEVLHLMDKLIEKRGDPNNSYLYERELRVVAILAQKPGFKLPFDIAERLAYVEKQMRYFADLPLSVVLDIRFFLQSTLNELVQSHDTITFLTARNPLLKKAMEIIKLRSLANGLKQVQSEGQSS